MLGGVWTLFLFLGEVGKGGGEGVLGGVWTLFLFLAEVGFECLLFLDWVEADVGKPCNLATCSEQ